MKRLRARDRFLFLAHRLFCVVHSYRPSRSDLDLTRVFYRIHPEDLHGTRYFFEANEHALDVLNIEAYFPILAAYVNALFSLGDFEKMQPYADRLLELSLTENLSLADGDEDVFTKTLFQKSYSLLRLKQTDRAVELARQLLGIAPDNPRNARLLRLALVLRRPFHLQLSLGAGAALGLSYLVMLATGILVVEPYFPEHLAWFGPLSTGIWQSAVFAVLAGSAFHHLSAWRQTVLVRRSARAKAAQKARWAS